MSKQQALEGELKEKIGRGVFHIAEYKQSRENLANSRRNKQRPKRAEAKRVEAKKLQNSYL